VYWSEATVALVPKGVVTLTSNTPALPAGAVAVIEDPLTTAKLLAAVAPKLTAEAPVKPVPVMVTEVPPTSGPDAGLIADTVGTDSYVKLSAELVALVPPEVATVTSTVPAEPAGEAAVTLVALTTVKLAAAVVPNLTAVAPVNPVPVIVTDVPPAGRPATGFTAVTTGMDVYVN
jgi:hypothetical protein